MECLFCQLQGQRGAITIAASEADISRSYLTKMLKGERPWSDKALTKIREWLKKLKYNPNELQYVCYHHEGCHVGAGAAPTGQYRVPYTYNKFLNLGFTDRKLAKVTSHKRDTIRRVIAGRPLIWGPEGDIQLMQDIARAVGVRIWDIPWMHDSQWAYADMCKSGEECYSKMSEEELAKVREQFHRDIKDYKEQTGRTGETPAPPIT